MPKNEMRNTLVLYTEDNFGRVFDDIRAGKAKLLSPPMLFDWVWENIQKRKQGALT